MAINRMARALDEFVIAGVESTLPLFRRLVNEPDIRSGDYSIHWLERWLADQGH
jgi:acetyl-CoA carboxylase biotin carboxylase subunit